MRPLSFATATALSCFAASTLPSQTSSSGSISATPCKVDVFKELWIKDLSVVEDPVRTTYVNGSTDPTQGCWSFGRLMENMAGGQDASDFVLDMFDDFLVDQVVNGHLIPARPELYTDIIQPWIDQSEENGIDGLDFSIAPFRLNGIVNRIDLRSNTTYGTSNHAGEGRIIFSFLRDGEATLGTLILEYELIAPTCQHVKAWAEQWHALGQIKFGEDYNRALQHVVDRFAGANAAPGRPNGSAIAQVRTNEILGLFPWQWREWHLANTGFLVQATVAQTVQTSLNGTQLLADFINQNEVAILNGTHIVPATFQGQPFLGGASDGEPTSAFFDAPGINNNEARHRFSLLNCVACHTIETGTSFFHSGPRSLGQETFLSPFLTGTVVNDPVDQNVQRRFSDLRRRHADLCRLLQASCGVIEVEPVMGRVH